MKKKKQCILSTVYFISDLGKKRRQWVFDLPPYALFKKCETLCLIVAGYFLNLHLEMNDPATWRIISQINSVTPTTRNEATLFLVKQVRPFLQVCPLTYLHHNNIHEMHQFLDKSIISYCDFSGTYKFEAQYHIFHKHTGNYLTSIPSEYKSDIQQMYFLGCYIDGQITIVALISNLTTFFSTFGIFCHFCKKQFRGKGTQHKCLLTQTCFCCRRPLLGKNSYCNTTLKKYFCDSSLQPLVAKKCPKCNLLIVSPHCEKNHLLKVCRWGYFCSQCEMYTYQSKFMTKKEIAQKHECGKRACYFCGETDIVSKKSHICRMQLPQKDSNYTNLAFLDLQISGSSPAICQDCFRTSSGICNACQQNKQQTPILATFLVETKKRGHFDKYTFYSHKTDRKKNFFCSQYVPCHLEVPITKSGQKTKFGNVRKIKISSQTFEFNSILDFVFYFLMNRNLQNYTILVDDHDHNVLSIIVEFLFSHGIFPQVIGSPTILCLNIPSLAIRFINSENYLDESFSEQVQKAPYQPVYFPLKWRKTSNISYSGVIPPLSDYYTYDDSNDQIQCKKDFVGTQKFPWNFLDNLSAYSEFCIQVLAFHCLDFLKQSLQCQTLIQSWFDEPSTLPPVHPFNAPLCTRASYAYKLLCIFCKDMENLRVVLPPISMQSSAGELEYCSYKIWEKASTCKSHQFAWSKFGQKYFKEAVPDLLLDNVCHFWNGCMIHGHKENICLFKRGGTRKRNMFGETFENAFANYENKKKRFKLNHPELKVEEMWQCSWQTARKEDPKIIFFLKHIYKNPPVYRLNARAAGKIFQQNYCIRSLFIVF